MKGGEWRLRHTVRLSLPANIVRLSLPANIPLLNLVSCVHVCALVGVRAYVRLRVCDRGYASHDEGEQTLNQLLACMDGIDSKGGKGVVLLSLPLSLPLPLAPPSTHQPPCSPPRAISPPRSRLFSLALSLSKAEGKGERAKQ